MRWSSIICDATNCGSSEFEYSKKFDFFFLILYSEENYNIIKIVRKEETHHIEN